MSNPLVTGLERPPRELSSAWIQANVTAAGVAFVMGLVAFAARQAFDLTEPNTGLLATVLLYAVEIATAVIGVVVYANRTGAVLQQKLPAFPLLTWTALHILIGIVIGTVTAFVEQGAKQGPPEPAAPSLVANMVIGGMFAGAVIGAGLGALQALILRKVAREVGLWISWSALAGTTFGAYALVLYLEPDRSLGNEVITLGVGFLIAVAAGVIMLPALHRMAPR